MPLNAINSCLGWQFCRTKSDMNKSDNQCEPHVGKGNSDAQVRQKSEHEQLISSALRSCVSFD
jgi:hypothetical protein